MFQLVYCSRATVKVDQVVLTNILEAARSYNPQKDITGLLLYKSGRFMQVLEGPEHEVRQLYAKIREDSRHEDVYTLYEGEAIARDFENWSMGFRDIADVDLSAFEEISNFFDESSKSDVIMVDKSHVKPFLHIFKGIA